jgi:hypothetical protein
MVNFMMLLQNHCPIYYWDKNEKILPMNLENYFLKKEVKNDYTITGYVVSYTSGYYLYYTTAYIFDGGMHGLDSHPFDLETLVIDVSNDYKIKGILFSPHAEKEHFWIRNENDLKNIFKNGRNPNIYCSLSKHAQYPINGYIFRYFGFANDKCFQPINKLVTINEPSESLIKSPRINSYLGIPSILNKNLDIPKNIRLSKVKTNQLFRFPKIKFSYYK